MVEESEGDIDKRFLKFEETLRELWKDGDKVYVSGTIINAIPFRIDTHHKSPHLIGEEIRERLNRYLVPTGRYIHYRVSKHNFMFYKCQS